MTNRARVYFSLHGDDFDPAEVTRIVGLEPTSTRRKADPRPRYSSWDLSSDEIENDVIGVHEMAADLVARLAPHVAVLARAKHALGLRATLTVVLHISFDDRISTPAIGFDSNVIAFLATLGASIDIDAYRTDL